MSLFDLAKAGDLEQITETLSANPAWANESPVLTWAAANGRVEIVEILVKLGSINLDTPGKLSGYTPLEHAAANGHIAMIETLIKLGSQSLDRIAEDGSTPLSLAARYGRVEV